MTTEDHEKINGLDWLLVSTADSFYLILSCHANAYVYHILKGYYLNNY